jgi:hypothetical protein
MTVTIPVPAHLKIKNAHSRIPFIVNFLEGGWHPRESVKQVWVTLSEHFCYVKDVDKLALSSCDAIVKPGTQL